MPGWSEAILSWAFAIRLQGYWPRLRDRLTALGRRALIGRVAALGGTAGVGFGLGLRLGRVLAALLLGLCVAVGLAVARSGAPPAPVTPGAAAAKQLARTPLLFAPN